MPNDAAVRWTFTFVAIRMTLIFVGISQASWQDAPWTIAIVSAKRRVVMLGSGNWGCAFAQILGWNTAELNEHEEQLNMYVFEETVKGRKLT